MPVSEPQTGPDNADPDRRGDAEGRRAYLRDLMGVLERSKEGAGADAASLEAVSKQLEVLRSLEAVLAARLRPDPRIGAPAEAGPGDQAGVAVRRDDRLRFDARVDDDEVLLRLFEELDEERSGCIRLEGLLRLMRAMRWMRCPLGSLPVFDAAAAA